MTEAKGRKQRTSFYLGDIAPNFKADSSKGPIDFYEYLGNSWGVLFCYPDDFAPVATTELALFSQLQAEFVKRNVKLLAMSTHNTLSADGTYKGHGEWIKDVEEIGNAPLAFPIIDDNGGVLADLYHVLDEADIKKDKTHKTHQGLAYHSRTAFIIGPGKHFRLILRFPAAVGMSTGEVFRLIDALQTAAHADIRTPANWMPGGDVIIPRSVKDEEAKQRFGDFKTVKPYLRFSPLPLEKTTFQAMNGTEQTV